MLKKSTRIKDIWSNAMTQGLETDRFGKEFFVYGFYRSMLMAEEAVVSLEVEGFEKSDIRILSEKNEKCNKAPEGSLFGSGVGAIVGAAIAIFSVSHVSPPLSLLMGVTLGAILGGALGLLAGMSLSRAPESQFSKNFKDRDVLVMVKALTSIKKNKALVILNETGAEDVSTEGGYQETFRGHDRLSLTH